MRISALQLLVCGTFLFIGSWNNRGVAAPGVITKPAGELPVGSSLETNLNHANIDSTLDMMDEAAPKKIGSAKSRVIPKSRMATADSARKDVQADVGPRVISKQPGKAVEMRRVASSAGKTIPEPRIDHVDFQSLAKDPSTHTARTAEDAPTQPASETAPAVTSEAKSVTAPKNHKSHDGQKSLDGSDAVHQEPETKVLRVEDVVEQTETFHFAGKDKPDPFIPPLGSVESKQELKTLSADEIPIVSPLQYFTVKQLLVTGVWQGADNRWKAMIETPDQQGVIVQSGDPIGNSGGHVANIGPNGVKVRQYRLQRDGARLYGETVIGMAPETAEKPETGGKIILKPGVERPEVQLPDANGDIDENGNVKAKTRRGDAAKGKTSQADNKDVVIGPDANAIRSATASAEGTNDLPAQMPKMDGGDTAKAQGDTLGGVGADPKIPPAPTPPPMSEMPTMIPNVLPAGGSL